MIDADENPFVPCFGVPPPVLVGRDLFLDDMRRILDGSLYRKASTSIVIGSRGSGKSVLLRVVEQQAYNRGWRVLSTTPASDGLLTLLTNGAATLWHDLEHERKHPARRKLSSVTVLGGEQPSRPQLTNCQRTSKTCADC